MQIDTCEKKNDTNDNNVEMTSCCTNLAEKLRAADDTCNKYDAESIKELNGDKQIAPKIKLRKVHHRRPTFTSCLTKLVALGHIEGETQL